MKFFRSDPILLRQFHGDPPQTAGQNGSRQFISHIRSLFFQGASLPFVVTALYDGSSPNMLKK